MILPPSVPGRIVLKAAAAAAPFSQIAAHRQNRCPILFRDSAGDYHIKSLYRKLEPIGVIAYGLFIYCGLEL